VNWFTLSIASDYLVIEPVGTKLKSDSNKLNTKINL